MIKLEQRAWSIRFFNDVYTKYLGIQPKSFWNPECGWRNYVPHQAAECGYKNLIADFEAYCRSCKSDGTPQRPEIYEKEFSKEPAFYDFAFKYELQGDEKAVHFPFERIRNLHTIFLILLFVTSRIVLYKQ